jgi:biopolymer transport protein ExbD
MASLPNAPASSKQPRMFRPTLRVDMTPLVDLGFLLITFFIFTSNLGSQAVMPLVMPADGPPTDAGASAALTVLLGRNNEVAAYNGFWEDAVAHKNIAHSNYHVTKGIGALIRQKQQQLAATGRPAKDLVLLVKPLPDASYKNVVDVLDEVTINGVSRYAIIAPTDAEASWMLATATAAQTP